MSSNIRSKPIEGHVTDSAGNVIRNARIVIKQATPSGSFSVDSVYSDDSGYFLSRPLPNGIYDIYESGIIVSRTIHTADQNSIQCFKAYRDNYNVLSVENFDTLVSDSELNNFRGFIQIEPAEIDIPQYGSSFPIYNFIFPSSDPALSGNDNDLWELSQFFDLSTDSRITTTRFDIEYFSPLTALSNIYKRIRWSGVPAIKFYQDSKLVIPLDYFSMVLNYPKVIAPETVNFGVTDIKALYVTDSTISLANVSANNSFKTLALSVTVGDVLKVNLVDLTVYYGIIIEVDVSGDIYTITLEKLLSSRYVTDATTIDTSGTYYALRIQGYDGMFRGITDIDEEVNERFTVVENIYAQDLQSELYSYVNQY